VAWWHTKKKVPNTFGAFFPDAKAKWNSSNAVASLGNLKRHRTLRSFTLLQLAITPPRQADAFITP